MKADLSDFKGTSEDINALPDQLRSFIHHLEANCDPAHVMQENFILRELYGGMCEVMADVKAGMYVRCIYCSTTFTPGDKDTPETMAEMVKKHITGCAKHPMNLMVKRCRYLERIIKAMRHGTLAPNQDLPSKECSRASGEVPCDICGLELNQHFQPLPTACPTVVEDCNGIWWKL